MINLLALVAVLMAATLVGIIWWVTLTRSEF